MYLSTQYRVLNTRHWVLSWQLLHKKKSPPDLPRGSTARPFSRRQRPTQRGPAHLEHMIDAPTGARVTFPDAAT
jgi:hypothetical protein